MCDVGYSYSSTVCSGLSVSEIPTVSICCHGQNKMIVLVDGVGYLVLVGEDLH